ncbi:MAG: hypothetical protein ABIG39_06870 [Candidatus Micrarchaeota archaeon]
MNAIATGLRPQPKLRGLSRPPSSFRRMMPPQKSPRAFPKRVVAPRARPGRFFLKRRVAAVLTLAALTLFAFAKKIEGKPPPFYKNTSLFTYVLKTPTDGMDGGKTDFWVKEAGASVRLPLTIPLAGTKTSFTVMGLGGVTRCEGVPMAETDFGKFAVTSNTSSGKFNVALGARHLVVESKDVELHMGPRTITIPGETMTDWDVGIRAEWARGHGEQGVIRSAKLSATVFDMGQRFRKGYRVFSGSVGFQDGWGLSISGETKSGNIGVMGEKGFAWGRGKYLLLLGAGYDIKPKSISGYIGGKVGPVMIIPMYQAEKGDKSYHLLITINPTDILNAITGAGKTKGHGHGN